MFTEECSDLVDARDNLSLLVTISNLKCF